MTTRQELSNRIIVAGDALNQATAALAAFDGLAENNIYDDLETALAVIENQLEGEAFDDCEGSGNCGSPEYTQEFIVAGVLYMATLKVEYNRHDKQYYYIDGSEFSHEEVK